MKASKHVPRCDRHPRMSPILESRDGCWVFLCTACSPDPVNGGKVLGIASINQAGHEYGATLRMFDWRGEDISLKSDPFVDDMPD